MDQMFEQKLMIDSRDVDGLNQCRPSALLGHLQEAATQAAEDGKFGRTVMLNRYGAFWALTRIWFQLERPLRWGEELTVRTWHRGGRGAIMYRDFDLLVGDHRVGESVSAWVMMNRDTGRVVKLSTVSELRETGGGSLCKERTLSKIRFPQEMAPVERRLMRYSDSDINGHVNNTKYADFVCDAVHLDRREKGEFVSEMQIGYLAQCWPNEEIEIRTARWDGGWFVGGEDEACTPRFEACVRLSSEA